MPAPVASGRPRLTTAEQLRGFWTGAVDAVVPTTELVLGLLPLSAVYDPEGWFDRVRVLGDGIAASAEHPREALEAVLGLDLLSDGRYGEWLGGLAPDLLSGVLTGGGLPTARRASHVAEELTELADDVGDLSRLAGRAEAGGRVERRAGADVPDGYLTHVRDLTPERRRHILDGDPPEVNGGKGGGHRNATNKPGKTEFPADWTDDDIIRRVMLTARSPEDSVLQRNGRWQVTAEHDGVTVEVIVRPDGDGRGPRTR